MAENPYALQSRRSLGLANLADPTGANLTTQPYVMNGVGPTGLPLDPASSGYNDPTAGYAMGTTPAASTAAPMAPIYNPWATVYGQGAIDSMAAPATGQPAPETSAAPDPEEMNYRMLSAGGLEHLPTAPGTPGAPRSIAQSRLDDVYDPSSGRDMADAAYKQATEYFAPDFARDRSAAETRLANQGFAIGSEGYNSELDRMERQQELARTNAALGAVGVGNQQALGLAGLALGARGQDTSAAVAQTQAGAAGASAAAARDASMANAELQAQIAMRQLGISESGQNFQQLMQLIAGARGGVPNLSFGSPVPLDVTGAYGINQSAANANALSRGSQNAGLFNLGATLLGSYFGQPTGRA